MNFLAILNLLEEIYKQCLEKTSLKLSKDEEDFSIEEVEGSDDYDQNILKDYELWTSITLFIPCNLMEKYPFLPWDNWALNIRKASCYKRCKYQIPIFTNEPLHSEYDLMHRRGGKPDWRKESYYKPIRFIVENIHLPWNFKVISQRRDITIKEFLMTPNDWRHWLKDNIENSQLLDIGVKPCVSVTTPDNIINYPNINWNFDMLSYYMDFDFMVTTMDKYPWKLKNSYAIRHNLERYRSKKTMYELHNFLVTDIRKVIMDYI